MADAASASDPTRLSNRAGDAPLVSVVMPAYNCARYIGTAIASVLSQTYSAVELLVVDDGSTDDTVAMVRSVQASHPERIRLFQQANAGSAVARNRGLKEAKGDLIAFLDADDIWYPEKVRAQVDYLAANPGVALVYCGWKECAAEADLGDMDHQQETVVSADLVDPKGSGWIYPLLLTECAVWTSTVMARRSLIESVGGFDPALRRGQDYDYWLRCSQLTRIVKLARVMALYRILPDSITRRAHAENYEYLVLRKSLARWGRVSPDGAKLPGNRLRRRLFGTWYHFATSQFHAGAYRAATSAALRSLAYRPFDPRGLALLAESVARYAVSAIIPTKP